MLSYITVIEYGCCYSYASFGLLYHRLAWERGLVAAVLLGSIPLHCASSSNKESTGNHSNGVNIPSSQNIRAQDPQGVQALLVVSRLLCQIHMSRYVEIRAYLRTFSTD
jgi:hypothetical protein